MSRPAPEGSTHPLWFYWGEPHMSFLRYLTLYSACRVHRDVRLILRRTPANRRVKWFEAQDFLCANSGPNWMDRAVALPLEVLWLEDVSPEVAGLGADGVHTSDLLSWWLLANKGGTVCDMDIVFLKPLPAIEHDVEVPIWTKRFHRYDYLPIAYLQGRPAEKWAATFRSAMARYQPNVYQSCGGENFRPWPEPNLDPAIVYPWVGSVYRQILQYCFDAPNWPPIPESCIGIHWYAGGTQGVNQRILGPEGLRDGAVAWAAKEVLNDESFRG